MLNITGRGTAQTCDGLSRRDFLQVGSLGAAGVTLADLERARAEAPAWEPSATLRYCLVLFSTHLVLFGAV